MTTAILATAFTVGLITGGGLLLLFFRRARPAGGSLPVKAAVVEHSPVGTLILDSNLSVTFANEAFCHFFTLAADQVVGRGIQDILDTRLKAIVEQPGVFESSLLAAYAPGAPTSSLEIHVLSEGPREQLWLDHTSHEISEGPLAGHRVAYFVDITPARSLVVGQEAKAERQEESEMTLVKLSREQPGRLGEETSPLHRLAQLANKTLRADRVEVWQGSQQTGGWTLDHLRYRTARRGSEETPDLTVPRAKAYMSMLAKSRVLVVNDTGKEENSGDLIGQDLIDPQSRARLDIPIRAQGSLVGALVIAQRAPRAWTREEEQFAASIGDRASLIAETSQERISAPPASAGSPGPIDSNPVDGYVHLDTELRFTFLNPAVLQWLKERDFDGDALVGTSLVTSLGRVEDTSLVAEIRKAARGGGPQHLRRQIERSGPWLDIHINPSPMGVGITIQNRAMRCAHETARSVLESETRFRSVVESLREGLIITDLDDRILYVNPRITDLTGRRPEELAGQTAQDLLFETEGWKEADSRLAARRNQTRMRYELDRDGKVHPVQVISSPVRNSDGDVTGVVDAITDLAELQGLRSEEAGAQGS